jgi:hypothetical protein
MTATGSWSRPSDTGKRAEGEQPFMTAEGLFRPFLGSDERLLWTGRPVFGPSFWAWLRPDGSQPQQLAFSQYFSYLPDAKNLRDLIERARQPLQ